MPDWSASGYDQELSDRWLYGFYSPSWRRLKFGLVLRESHLRARLNEVRRVSKMPDLEMVWSRCLTSMSHEEAEHVEAATRLWLARSGSFRFIGKVDWLAVADNVGDFSELLNGAVDAAQSFGPDG